MSSAIPKITVHWLDQSRAQRILWLLEELELPYEVKTYYRNKKDMLAPPELREVHPLGKSPVITIEEQGKDKLTIAESGAIAEYLVERFGKGKLGVPAGGDPEMRTKYLFWVHAAEGTFMLALMLTIIMSEVISKTPYPFKPVAWVISSQVHKIFIQPRLKENFGLVESTLSQNPFLLGSELSAADLMIYFPVEGLVASKNIEQEYPATAAWFKKCSERPAFKRAEEKGGKNDMKVFLK